MTLRTAGRAAAALSACGIGVLSWSLVEAQCFTVRAATLPLLPPGARPLRLLHVSDIHLTPGQHRKARWVRDLARLEPDLVVSTGDNIATADALDPALEALAPLLALPGAFVFGSNDYFGAEPKNPAKYLRRRRRTHPHPSRPLPADRLAAGLAAGGWANLNNARARLHLDGLDVDLVGMDDPHIGLAHMPPADGGGPLPADREAPAPAIGRDAPTLRLGVVHAPYRWALDALAEDGAQLLLAGHTHGGQLCLPGGRALVTNCDLDTARASGLHGWPGLRPDDPAGTDSVWLHVSAGLGTSPYTPVRLFCRPEVTMLTLAPKPASGLHGLFGNPAWSDRKGHVM